MVTMQFLRMLADAAFFYMIAATIAVGYGAGSPFLALSIQSLCFALSSLGGKHRAARLALLLPMGLCWYVCRGSLADSLLLLPVGGYVLWLAWQGDYALSHDRQCSLFTVMVRTAAVFAPVAGLMSGLERVMTITLPLAMVSLVASVLLMRALRHEPRVYCQRKYQLVNLSAVAAAVAAAWLLSAEPVVQSCLQAVGWLYRTFVLPILILLLQGGLLLLRGLARLLAFFRLELPQGDASVQIESGTAADVLSQWGEAKEPSELLRRAAVGLAALAVIWLTVRFFRWLNRRSWDRQIQTTTPESRSDVPLGRSGSAEREGTPARGIRAQYRKFLKVCAERGVYPERSSTSLDVARQAGRIAGLEELSGPIRELYIRARYGGRSSREDLREMKQLCTRAKKEAGERQ